MILQSVNSRVESDAELKLALQRNYMNSFNKNMLLRLIIMILRLLSLT